MSHRVQKSWPRWSTTLQLERGWFLVFLGWVCGGWGSGLVFEGGQGQQGSILWHSRRPWREWWGCPSQAAQLLLLHCFTLGGLEKESL